MTNDFTFACTTITEKGLETCEKYMGKHGCFNYKLIRLSFDKALLFIGRVEVVTGALGVVTRALGIVTIALEVRNPV